MMTIPAFLAAAAAAPAGMPWLKSQDKAFALARSTGKMVMVDFFTDW
jgi:hypothetical protein